MATMEFWFEFGGTYRYLTVARIRRLGEALSEENQNADTAPEKARSPENKAAPKVQTGQARKLGIFGSPTFIAGDELFWGDDRLEQALS